jgi:hypothetical protein
MSIVAQYFRTKMFWEEKMDRLKKEADSSDFKVPFREWSAMLLQQVFLQSFSIIVLNR